MNTALFWLNAHVQNLKRKQINMDKVYRCQTCGAPLRHEDGKGIVQCKYCGTVQSFFDDERSREYGEKLEAEYERNVRSLQGIEDRCVYSSDLIEAIRFFQENIDYKESEKYLTEAKYQYITHTNTYDECVQALLYTEEIAGYKDSADYREICMKNKRKFRMEQLIAEGRMVRVPYSCGISVMNRCIEKYLCVQKNEGSESRAEEDDGLIRENKAQIAEYINSSLLDSIEQAKDVSELEQLQKNIRELEKSGFLYSAFSVAYKKTESKINAIKKEENRETKGRRRSIVLAIVCIIVLGAVIIGIATYAVNKKNEGYLAKYFSLRVLSKENKSFNEELADGYYGAGYYYVVRLRLSNNGAHTLSSLRGNMNLKNKTGEILASFDVSLKANVETYSSATVDLTLHVPTGENAREIWNLQLQDLEFTFQIVSAHFEDLTYKEYKNQPEKRIYPVEEECNP